MSTSSGGLAIALLAESQVGKFLTINTAINTLDLATTGTLAVNVAAASATISAAQMRASANLQISGASVAGRSVTLPAVAKISVIGNTSAQPVSVSRGTTSLTLLSGESTIVALDGTANGLARVGAAIGGQRVEFAFSRSGTTTANEVVAVAMVRPTTLPASLSGSVARATVAATNSTSFVIQRTGGGAFGTITFAAASATGSISAASSVTLAASDILSIVAPATPDPTLANISIVLAGTRG